MRTNFVAWLVTGALASCAGYDVTPIAPGQRDQKSGYVIYEPEGGSWCSRRREGDGDGGNRLLAEQESAVPCDDVCLLRDCKHQVGLQGRMDAHERRE